VIVDPVLASDFRARRAVPVDRHWPRPLVALLALGLCACGSTPIEAVPDAGSSDARPRDLSVEVQDLSHEDPGDAAVALDSSVAGCDDTDTFTAAQTAMLTGCAGLGPMSCHSRDPLAGGLDLTAANAYASLVGVDAVASPGKKRVVPFHPEQSFLVDKLTNNLTVDEGNPMPQGEGIMWRAPDPARLHVLECWIARGAAND
jgi:hypothetical protein